MTFVDAAGGKGRGRTVDRDTVTAWRKLNSQLRRAATYPVERVEAAGSLANPLRCFQIRFSRASFGRPPTPRRSPHVTTQDRGRTEQGCLRGRVADVRRALACPRPEGSAGLRPPGRGGDRHGGGRAGRGDRGHP